MKLSMLFATLMLLLGCARTNPQVVSSLPDAKILSLHWEATGTSSNVTFCDLVGSTERIALETDTVLDTRHFVTARAARDEVTGHYTVYVEMTADGRRRMTEESAENVGRRLAIVLDGGVVALPKVMATIDGADFPLMGIVDAATANDLALGINAAIQRIRTPAEDPRVPSR